MNNLQSRPLSHAGLLIVVILFSAICCFLWNGGHGGFGILATQAAAAPATAPPPNPTNETAALRAELERFKGLLPDQAHVMKDVGYHFANLWFAGEKKNWPLADFYWSETRSHLRWAVRIIPVRQDPQGHEIRLAEILEPMERSALEDVHQAIIAKDAEKFAGVYRQMLDSCYACHLVVGKPFLRLQIPRQPEAPIINFEPSR